MTTEHVQLWQALQQANCVDAEASLPKPPLMPPWYLGILQGFAGWIAALFLLGFLILSLGHTDDKGILFFGALFVVLGAVLDRQSLQQQVFVTQLALVFGLSGLLSVGWALSEIFGYRSEQAWFFSFGALLMVHSIFINNRLSIFLNGIGIAVCITGLLFQWQMMSVMPLVMLVLVIVLCLNLQRLGAHYGRLCTLAYGFASWTLLAQGLLSLGASELDFFTATIGELSIWSWLLPWSLSLLASLLLVRHIFEQRQISLTTPVGYGAIATLIVVGALAVPLTGLSTAVLFLLLGLQLRDKVFTALAIFSIPLFISAYYYSLSVSLLEKSLLLTALGAVLLLARWGLNRYLSQPSSVTSQEAL